MPIIKESDLQDGEIDPRYPAMLQRAIQGGTAIEHGYEAIAKPVTKGIGMGLGVAERQGLLGPVGMALPHVASPETQAQMAVPQTIPEAAMMAVTGGLPGGAGREAMNLGSRMATSRLGRIGTTAGVGALASGLTGGDPLTGAAQGALATIPGELSSKIGGNVATRIAGGMEDVAAKDTSNRFSGWLAKHMPWLGEHKSPVDLQRTFINDFGRDMAGPRYGQAREQVLQTVQDWANKRGMQKAQIFSVPDFSDPLHPKTAFTDFETAEKLIKELNDHGWNIINGQERGSISGEAYRAASRDLRNSLSRQLEGVDKGLGQYWLKNRNEYGQYEELQRLIRGVGIGGDVEGISQNRLMDRLQDPKHIDGLNAVFGKDKVADLMKTIQRDYKGVKTDVPGEKGGMRGYAMLAPHPHVAMHPQLGKGYKMVGKAPAFTNPSGRIMDPAALAIEQPLFSNQPYTDNPSPYSMEKDRLNAEQFVGTKNPERIETVAKLQDKVRKDKQPRVEAELRTGRLSMPAMKRMLSGMTEQNAQATLKRLTPVDAAHLYALADPYNKIWLTPIIEDKLQALIQSGRLPPDIAEELMHGRIEA